MEPSDEDLKRSGAVAATCMAYHKYSSLYPMWDNMKQWAEREFRQYSPSTIDRLIELAKTACDDAYRKRFLAENLEQLRKLNDIAEAEGK